MLVEKVALKHNRQVITCLSEHHLTSISILSVLGTHPSTTPKILTNEADFIVHHYKIWQS